MNLPFKVNEREKRYLIIGAIGVVLIILFQLFSWYSDTKKSVQEYSDAKLLMLQKQINRLSAKDDIQKRYNAVKLELERLDRTLLSGNTPPVAAAALQKLLKDTATSLNIDVKLERALSPVDAEYYLGIPVEVGFTASTVKLQDMLVLLRKSPSLLTVTEIKIRVTNIRNPEEIYTTLVVTGFIRKTEEKETDKKEA